MPESCSSCEKRSRSNYGFLKTLQKKVFAYVTEKKKQWLIFAYVTHKKKKNIKRWLNNPSVLEAHLFNKSSEQSLGIESFQG